jgi:hypothetical protein
MSKGAWYMGTADEMSPLEELSDTVLRQEIELLGDVIETVANADHPLGQAEIDRALHLPSGSEELPAVDGAVS